MRLPLTYCYLFAALLLLIPVAATAKPAQITASPLLWEVKGPKATVYLFGSTHAMRENVEWYIPPIRERFERSANMWFELSNPDDKHQARSSMREHCTTIDMTQGLTPAETKQLDVLLKPQHLSIQQFKNMKKMMVLTLLAVADMIKMHYQPELGIDMVLREKALKLRKHLNGFETIDDQIRMICGASEKESLAAMQEYMREYDKNTVITNMIFDSWITGNEKAISELMDKEFRESMPQFYAQMLLQRNKNWQPTIENMIKGEEDTFVTVGAAHLAGPDGIVAELKRRGYKVQQVDTSTPATQKTVQ